MTDNNEPTPHDRRTPLLELVTQAVEGAREKQAEDVVVLDLRQSDAFTDYFVICSGRSSKQVTAIAESIEARLKAIGTRPAHIEGYPSTDWILIDYFDFIVHVFTPETREFYSLERLWGSSVRVDCG